MNLTQLANLGEFIGGVAVLVTLVYLAIQVRQNTDAQKATAKISAAESIQNSVNRYSAFRHLVANGDTGDIWAKARRDEALTATEETRLRAMIQELAYSAVATGEIWRAAGQAARANSLANSIVWELDGSNTLRRAWTPMSDELRVWGYEDLAEEVTIRLGADGNHT